jgi:type VI secretion system protein ImpK
VDRITAITKDCFNAIAQARDAEEGSLPSPEELHARLRQYVDELLRRGAAEGLGREEAMDVAYPVVALADEVILSRSSDALRTFWSSQPLQLHYFQENVAGEQLFVRLDAIRKDPRRSELLRAYHLALLFGFQGRYRVRGGELELMSLVDGLARDLARGRKHDVEVLSPAGDRPAESIGRAGRAGPLLWIAGGALVLSLVLYLGLRVSLAAGTSAVEDRIAATANP